MANIGDEIVDGSVRWIVRDTRSEATTVSSGLMSASDKIKLNGYPSKTTGNSKFLREDGTWQISYTLPKATTNSLGGMIVGNNLTVTDGKVGVSLSGNANHVLKGNGTWDIIDSYTLPQASTTVLGGVKIADNKGITIGSGGIISLSPTAAGKIGGVSLPSSATAERYLNALGNWTKPGFENDSRLYTIKLPVQTGYLEYELKQSQFLRPSWNGYDNKKMKLSTVPSASVTAYVTNTLGQGTLDAGKRKAALLLGCAEDKARINSRVSSRFTGLHVVAFTPRDPYKWEDGTNTPKMTHWLVNQRTLDFDILPAQTVSFNNPLYLYYDTEDTNNYNDHMVRQTITSGFPEEGKDGVEDSILTFDFETVKESIDANGNYVTEPIGVSVTDAEREDSKRLYLFANGTGAGSSVTAEDGTGLGQFLHFRNIDKHLTKHNEEYTNISYIGSTSHERCIKVWCKEGTAKGVIQVLSIGQPETKGFKQSSRELVIFAKKEEPTFEFTDETLDYSLIELTNAKNYSIDYDYDQPLYTAAQVAGDASIIPEMRWDSDNPNLEKARGIVVSPETAANVSISAADRKKVFSDGKTTYYRYTKLNLRVEPKISTGTFTVTIRPPASKLYLRPAKKVMKFVVNPEAATQILNYKQCDSVPSACGKVKEEFMNGAENKYKVGDYISFRFIRDIPLQARVSEYSDYPDTANPKRYISIPANTTFKAVLIGINHFQNCSGTNFSTGNSTKFTYTASDGSTITVKSGDSIGGHFCICKDEDNFDIAFNRMALCLNNIDYGYGNVTMFGGLKPAAESLTSAMKDIDIALKDALTVDNSTLSTGYNENTPLHKWLNSTFYYSMPTELKRIMSKSKVACISKNLHAYNSLLDSNPTSYYVRDSKLWLLSWNEYSSVNLGTQATDEKNACARYEYFKTGNYIVKYCHNDTESTVNYFLTRTQRISTSEDESGRNKYHINAYAKNTKPVKVAVTLPAAFAPCFII